MKVLYLSTSTNFEELVLDSVEVSNQNKYGKMHSFKEKIELVTNEPTADYHSFHSKDNKEKLFLCVKSPQLNVALQAIREKLIATRGYQFKVETKDICYVRISPEQAAILPRNQQINVSVKVYGVFYQANTKNSFLQLELTGFKSYPLVHFE